ncbi:DUF4231 domain-containing protein [Kibdelosporangium phytohabitans]|uniref:DUF4231 domain-containing protein n=1 Tax=Kibdelosporangium phytohabitans TaxID=860235 RepID=A0A0N9HYY6_9PSEU|nr:DUF4231 domain-containing protein [Kibdelosporangium phytohabitans]ALG08978.1 hypothetical protein AOZ06_20500 [Kibdelosporangium phytohabitans]MBE1469849.1 hypothetical protein [Kibdelosporangium phytohabitans]
MSDSSRRDDDLEELRRLVDQQVMPLVDWYQRKKRWPRRFHKFTAGTVIVLGAVIPIASVLPGSTATRVIIGAIGVAITAISSLSASYDWHRKWRLSSIAQNLVESHLATWELAMTKARLAPSPVSMDDAIAATEALITAANRARNEETRGYFEDQREISAPRLDRSTGMPGGS